ncbi:MAG: cyclopropane-fatty-acyl-phospholipid synthase family protein, partial [Hyphomicrobiales bacterium]
MRFLPKLLNKAVKSGTLTLIEPDGNRTSFGEPDGSKPVTMKIHDKSLDWKIAFNPELKTAEAYMDGTLTFEDGEVYDLLTLFYRNRRHFDHSANMIFWSGVARSMKRLHQHNPISKSRANVKHHYDLKDELFDLFLDEDKQYSCAYFPSGDETLEEAQTAKKSHIISKLNLKPGQKVLDIGCGWGGMALQIAATEDVTVKGITLSDNQARIARQRAEEAGVSDRVSFEICDYRELDEKFDRIVSVGMLE